MRSFGRDPLSIPLPLQREKQGGKWRYSYIPECFGDLLCEWSQLLNALVTQGNAKHHTKLGILPVASSQRHACFVFCLQCLKFWLCLVNEKLVTKLWEEFRALARAGWAEEGSQAFSPRQATLKMPTRKRKKSILACVVCARCNFHPAV